ncbi:MAG: hypothetical protein SNI51_06025 [Rikenellaceae bacterium]
MKIYKLLLMCCFSAITIMSTSCNTKSIDNQDDGTETPETSAVLTYKINDLHDLPTFFDINASYTDASGQTSSVDIESIPHTITVDGFNLDQVVTLHLSFSLKDEYEVTKSSYTFGATTTISYLDSAGSLKSSTSDDSMTCADSKLDSAFEYYTSKGISINFDVEIP